MSRLKAPMIFNHENWGLAEFELKETVIARMISVILYGRNDSHGYNLPKRAAISINCIAEMLPMNGRRNSVRRLQHPQ